MDSISSGAGRVGRISAICVSEQKGTQKHYVEAAELRVDHGVVGDAHAGNWHRQVSLLCQEKIDDFRARGAVVQDGAFGENIIVQGIDFKNLPIGTRYRSGQVLLEMTQIGKECHSHCAIFKIMGDCIMPREGVFCKVLQPGRLQVGDLMEVVDAADVATDAAAMQQQEVDHEQ